MSFLPLALLFAPELPPALPPDLLLTPLPQPSTVLSDPPPLLTQLVIGAGLSASPYQVLGPGQDLSTLEGWHCLGEDNATLDVAGRCPFTGMVQRHPRPTTP